jgi:hypothetical protein
MGFDYLKELESKSIYIIRESYWTFAKFSLPKIH